MVWVTCRRTWYSSPGKDMNICPRTQKNSGSWWGRSGRSYRLAATWCHQTKPAEQWLCMRAVMPGTLHQLPLPNFTMTKFHKPGLHTKGGLPWWFSGKESACQRRRCEFNPWVRKIPWRRKWQPTPVFLPGKSHGHRDNRKQRDITESDIVNKKQTTCEKQKMFLKSKPK